MKKAGILGFLVLFVGFALLVPNACSSTAGGKSSQSTGKTSGTRLTQDTPSSYFTGDGRKNMSLAVLIPDAKGLDASENYLPTLVQGVLVGDLSKYSAISVLDRQNLEKVLKETESGMYKDEAEFLQLGEIVNVGYAMTGAITKTQSGFVLSVTVTDTKTGMTQAAYNGSCTVTELVNFTGVKKASQDLLTQLGVELTGQAKNELSAASATEYVNAQTALSKGIIAQRGGNTVESLALFYQANNYDPSFGEAAVRANTLSTTIRTGSIGENIRNDIAWRNEWINLLEECYAYFRAHPPLPLVSLVYDSNLKQGEINYRNETVRFSLNATLYPVQSPAYQILKDLRQGLEATGRNKDWGLRINLENLAAEDGSMVFRRLYRLSVELVNDQGKIIASRDDWIVKDRISTANVDQIKGRTDLDFDEDEGWYCDMYSQINRNMGGSWDSSLPEGDFIVLSNNNYYRTQNEGWLDNKVTSNTRDWVFVVRADDITDNMTFRIKNIVEFVSIDPYGNHYKLNRYGPDIIPVGTGRYNDDVFEHGARVDNDSTIRERQEKLAEIQKKVSAVYTKLLQLTGSNASSLLTSQNIIKGIRLNDNQFSQFMVIFNDYLEIHDILDSIPDPRPKQYRQYYLDNPWAKESDWAKIMRYNTSIRAGFTDRQRKSWEAKFKIRANNRF
jgi:TolB-like protein